MSGLNGGPSSRQLIAAANAAGTDLEHGRGYGKALSDAQMHARQQYAEPSVPGRESAADNNYRQGQDGGIPSDYNMQEGYPVRYDGPSKQKDRMIAKQAIIDNIPESRNGGVIRTAPVTEADIDYLQSMQDQIELADFDRWVGMKFNPRAPAQMQQLLSVYPEYVTRRLQQSKADYDFALRSQMISQWGIQTFDDMHFQYLLDQGKIKGPQLSRHSDLGDNYAAGWLAPHRWTWKQDGKNLRAPFAGATWGDKPPGGDPSLWEVSNGRGRPLSEARGIDDLAHRMYRDTDRPNRPGQ